MKTFFGKTAGGESAELYAISCGQVSASVTNYGASLVSLLCPDKDGNISDVVLGYDDAAGYETGTSFLGATVGRNANRLKDSSFCLNGREYHLTPNEGCNNLHSGPDVFRTRLWDTVQESESSVTFRLLSPAGDQGFPGNADIRVTYSLAADGGLHIAYDAVCDEDTVFNLTNHAYFNLAGHENTGNAMQQTLMIPGRHFCPDDAANIPTGECRAVVGSVMDFRNPKAIGADIDADYEPLRLQGGFDHNWEVFCNPCAILSDPESGREMAVYTDCPGVQFYSGNFLQENGKGGVYYGKRTGVALETQFYPDALHKPGWKQPITPKGQHYRSETVYRFCVSGK